MNGIPSRPRRHLKRLLPALGPSVLLIALAVFAALKFGNPAPPKRFVITTSDGEGDYQTFAKLYQEIIREDGVELEIRPSEGARENLDRLKAPKSGVDAGFVQDGLGSAEEAPDLSSIGSLYYEPVWVFYRGPRELTRLSQLQGLRVAIGREGGGTRILSKKLLEESGITRQNAMLIDLGWQAAADALKKGGVDAAIFVATPDDSTVRSLITEKGVRLMSLDQAEAMIRRNPYLHHVMLPHGAMDLARNLPDRDTDLVAPTATLLVRDSLHPALIYLLLKAASRVHDDPGIFEKKDEFPNSKDYQFPLADEAKQFYKSGAPFWQKYLPFWLATLVERFIVFFLPLLAIVLPAIRAVPRFLNWRTRSKIYQRYGELKFMETQIASELSSGQIASQLRKLDEIERRVNQMNVPLDFSDYVYHLREHIEFVRRRLARAAEEEAEVR